MISPSFTLIGAALIAGFVAGGAGAWKIQSGRMAEERATIARAVAAEKADSLRKERELQDAADQAQAKADAFREERDAANRAAADAAARLLNALRGAKGKCAAATTAAEREAADKAANLRAELLGRLDEMAGTISGFADESHQAGLVCQGLYEKAREVK